MHGCCGNEYREWFLSNEHRNEDTEEKIQIGNLCGKRRKNNPFPHHLKRLIF